jgi:hypothetical protein
MWPGGSTREPAEIGFSIFYSIRLWVYYPVYKVRVPVPEGELETAQKIVERFEKVLPYFYL